VGIFAEHEGEEKRRKKSGEKKLGRARLQKHLDIAAEEEVKKGKGTGKGPRGGITRGPGKKKVQGGRGGEKEKEKG